MKGIKRSPETIEKIRLAKELKKKENENKEQQQ